MLSLSPWCLGYGSFYEAAILSAKERRAGMKEEEGRKEEAREEEIDKETIHSEKKSLTAILKTKTKALMAHSCKGCSTREEAVGKVAGMGGKVAVGVGAGLCLGVGALAAAAVAEIAIPAVLTFKALALTGGALGLVKGAKDLTNKKTQRHEI
jgi:hypothetical protein